MRIFQITDCYPPPLVGGRDLHVQMLSHELRRAGHDVDVFAYFKYALESVAKCNNENDLQSLLPYNVNPEFLEAQRIIPVLLHSDK